MPPFVPRKRHRSPSIPTPEPPPKRAATRAKVSTERAKPSLFDTLDAKPQRTHTAEDNKAFLDSLGESHSGSSLSDASSDEFEHVHLSGNGPSKRRRGDGAGTATATDTEDDMEWEDAIPVTSAPGPSTEHAPSGDLSITIGAPVTEPSYSEMYGGGKRGPSKRDRQIRINTHRMHVQFLMFHNLIRNGWVCNKEVQKILVDRLPDGLKAEVERYRRAMGMAPAPEEEPKRVKRRDKLKGKGKGKSKQKDSGEAARDRIRDWGADASKLESNTPDLSQGDPLLRLLKYLSSYWKKRFRITAPGVRKQGYHSLAHLAEEVKSFKNDAHDPERHGERIRNIQDFMELAKKCEGSRDVGAQLFTALVRGLGLEARMVVNLQPAGFGWTKAEDAHVKKARKEDVAAATTKHAGDPSTSVGHGSEAEEKIPPKKAQPSNQAVTGDRPRHTITTPNGRKGRTPGRGGKNAPILLDVSTSDLSSAPESNSDLDASLIGVTPSRTKTTSKVYDRDLPFPVYWTEVLSPVSNTYVSVSPLVISTIAQAYAEDLLTAFEPRGTKADKAKQVIAYVVAYSADGTAKDVTTKYLKRRQWPGKTKGVRFPAEKVPIYNRHGKVKRYEQYDWFKTVMSGYTHQVKKRTLADDIEDQGVLQPNKPVSKAKPSREDTLQGYKNSAEFVLERHLRREEALLPSAKPVKQFVTGKGDNAKIEPVYLREDVVACKTVESWHKEGRSIKAGEQPLKYVPIRAVTVIRKREIEEAERDTGEKPTQGLYSKAQTEWIIPEPIKDGRIPRNAFGNIDVFVPTMVPKGAVHIPLRGTAKICKKLEIDFAEACIGFEFGKQRAVPVLTGVVVAAENEDAVIDAWEEDEAEKSRKEDAKREKLVLSMWRKFLMGLRIVERVRAEYGKENDAQHMDVAPFPNRSGEAGAKSKRADGTDQLPTSDDAEAGGGFMAAQAEEEVGGGFLHESAAESEDEALGGGFIVDDGDDAQPAPKRQTVLEGYPFTPISLQAAHRDTPDDSKSERSSDEEPQPTRSPPSRPSRSARARDGATRGRGRPRKNATKATTRATKRRAVKPDYGEDSGSSELSEASSYDPALSELGDGEPEKDSLPVKPKAVKKATTTTTRAVPKRQAARRSETAVKSHYFGNDTDEE